MFIYLSDSKCKCCSDNRGETNQLPTYGGLCCSVYLSVCVFQLWLSSSSIHFRSLLSFEFHHQNKPKTQFAMFLQLEFGSPDLLPQVCCSHFNWRKREREREGVRVRGGGLCGVWIGQTESIFVDLFHRYFGSRSLCS